MSGSTSFSSGTGPETRFVIDAVDALMRSDVVGARLALIEGADATSWSAIAHRLDVVGHALAVDAGLRSGDNGVDADHPADKDGAPAALDEILLLPGLDTSSWAVPHTEFAEALIRRWSTESDRNDLPLDRVWSTLAVVTWLVERGGYPAQVVA